MSDGWTDGRRFFISPRFFLRHPSKPLTGLYAKPPPGSECSPAPSEASSTATTTSPAADIARAFFSNCPNCQPTEKSPSWFLCPSLLWMRLSSPQRWPPNRAPLMCERVEARESCSCRGEGINSVTKARLDLKKRAKEARVGERGALFPPFFALFR